MPKLIYIIALATICNNLRSALAEYCNDDADVPHYNSARLAGQIWPTGKYSCNEQTLQAKDLKWWLESYTHQDNFWFGPSCNDKPKKYTATIQYPIGNIPQECFPPNNDWDNWSGWNAFTKDYNMDEKHIFKVWGIAVPVIVNKKLVYDVTPCAIVLQSISKKDATFESCPYYPEDLEN